MDISSLSVQDITTYLKNVMETESSLFKQKMARQEAKNCLQYNEPVKKEFNYPKLEQVQRPEEAKKPASITQLIFGPVLAVVGVIGVKVGIDWMGFGGFDVITGLCGVLFAGAAAIGGIGLVGAFFTSRSEAREDAYRYQREMREYEEKVAKAGEKHEQARKAYWQMKEDEEQRYSVALSMAREHYRTAKEQVQQLDKPLEETETVLQHLYDLDIIFPKYRNLPAVCMFYEYFASGRCSELSGPDGAYNLYEAELRQNLIINKLDAIMGSLEGIKQNQFILYTEVKKAADALPRISRDITDMLDTSQQLSQSAAITAQCAEVTKTNTDMLKYLAFIKH